MKHLFTPFQIRRLKLENRIVMPGLASFLFESDGSVTDRTVEHYRRRAAGGPAMVITEACAVSPEGIVSPHQARIYDDGFIEGFAKISAAIRSEGAVAALQIHHSGRQTSARVIGQDPLAPSELPCPSIQCRVTPLSIDGIHGLVQKFGAAAQRAHQAGFELIEIHGAHGYLINQFLSGFSNIRTDLYGGDTVKRARFAREIVREVRQRVGSDFPISFKISAQEFVPGGLTVAESIEILKILVNAGIDIVQVSAGNDATPEWICQPMFMKKACLADSAAKIKHALKIPVMTVGRINDPLLADKIIRQKTADLVCMGRGLLADPEMPKKAKAGRLEEIRSCIACNTCMASIFRKGRVECLVNPVLGREKRLNFQPAEKARKVLVIGSGPGGLNAARIAAKRGHEVHLFEKKEAIGGKLIVGSVPGFKKEISNLIKFLIKQNRMAGVKFHLNCEATPDVIRAASPDVVILATGAMPLLPQIEGVDRKMVVCVDDIQNGRQPDWVNTVIVGGGASGCETALYLAELGCNVTIVEMLSEMAVNLETITRKVILKKLEENKVTMLTGAKLVRILDNGVQISGNEGTETSIAADRVVMAMGNRPDNRLYQQLALSGYEVHRVGDCIEPRSIKQAIYEGTVAGGTV
ncbi:MAG: NAD(P)/FAD-dependent oxidoreductase [Desulfobacterales bacterium]|nr:NAD(P)/FAD-dependent oxidoreductase [Desulfobacterales bacterium]